jgi:DMSO/TMAO reductase YedYZ molybdopterin-dependent catalytic subunit
MNSSAMPHVSMLRRLRVSNRAVNLGLLALLVAALVSGIGIFLSGSSKQVWVVWSHSVAGFAIVSLLLWKWRIIVASLRRHGPGVWALPSLLLLSLLIAALASGILWSTTGLPGVAGESALTLHAAVSIALFILLAPHAAVHWPRLSAAHRPDRRAFLAATALLGAGALLWRGSEAIAAGTRLSGSSRRFTGSRTASSFSGNDFPNNSWLLDNPAPLNGQTWRLRIAGLSSSRTLTTRNLDPIDFLIATIDCTGGWYSTQTWGGAKLMTLLGETGTANLRSVVVRSATGYWRRLSAEQAASALLATTVGGEPLAHEHGAPARLVVPGSRGYDWVKWVTSVEASRAPWWWRWPLPLS